MKKLLAVWALALGAMLSATPASAITLTFTPSAQHVNVGDTVSVDVTLSGLGSEILSAYDLNFLWDSSVLNWAVITVSDNLGMSLGINHNGLPNGNAGFDNSSLEADADLAAVQPDDFLMFRFTFTALADGVTSFTLGLDPDFERNFVGLDALSLNVDVGSACIAVGQGECRTAVPEPGTLALLGLGVLGMGLSRRRRAV
jgi:hypothetical protein